MSRAQQQLSELLEELSNLFGVVVTKADPPAPTDDAAVPPAPTDDAAVPAPGSQAVPEEDLEFIDVVKVYEEDITKDGVLLILRTLNLCPAWLFQGLLKAGFKEYNVAMLYGKDSDLTGQLLGAHYDPGAKKLMIGFDHPVPSSIAWYTLHSLGTAVWYLLAKPEAHDAMKKHHGALYTKLTPFEQQATPGDELGAIMLFSQAFATVVLSREECVAEFGEDITQVVDDYITPDDAPPGTPSDAEAMRIETDLPAEEAT